jgi:predicted signal transduction protein with EAL and GGDEF domain
MLLTVDVREAAVSHDLPAAAGTLASFRARGGRVCLDDFATGVSSLSLLRRLPIDEVRIDRQAIDTITAHPHDRAIVRSIIAVVREIGLAVTAEGVETGAQADALIALGLRPPAGPPVRAGAARRDVRGLPPRAAGRGLRHDGRAVADLGHRRAGLNARRGQLGGVIAEVSSAMSK